MESGMQDKDGRVGWCCKPLHDVLPRWQVELPHSRLTPNSTPVHVLLISRLPCLHFCVHQ